jgi:hypothetical protein
MQGELMDFFLCAHLIYEAGLDAGAYRGQMNATHFEKWGAKKLTSNFPPQSVNVLDNSPYHCLLVDRPLSTCTVKSDMIWLCRKGIVSDETMSKHELPVNCSTGAQSVTGISGSSPEMNVNGLHGFLWL